jgi:hypothetical protein
MSNRTRIGLTAATFTVFFIATYCSSSPPTPPQIVDTAEVVPAGEFCSCVCHTQLQHPPHPPNVNTSPPGRP